jgi:hypothetical protein
MKYLFLFSAPLLFSISVLAQNMDANTQSFQDAFSNYNDAQGVSKISTSETLIAFSHKEETKGSRYLFNKWVQGEVINSRDSAVNVPTYMYNYDKVNDILLVKVNDKNMIEVGQESVKSFTLHGDTGDYHFERVNNVVLNGNAFFQVLVRGGEGKYTLCKMAHTKFVKADYVSTGLVESGTPYDEYVETVNYYLLLPDGKTMNLLPMKVRLLRELIADGNPAFLAYLHDHRYDEINEAFFKGLVNAINQ